MISYFLFFTATVLAGTINALAGGGGLITFTLLTLVVTPVTADATSAVALFFATFDCYDDKYSDAHGAGARARTETFG